MLKYLILFLVAFISSFLLTPLVRFASIRLGVLDIPDERKVHKNPIPRLGGISIFVAFNLGLFLATQFEFFYLPMSFLKEIRYNFLFAGSILVMGLGAIDDIKTVPVSLKFLFQIVAGLFAVLAFPKIGAISLPFATIHLGSWSIPITVLWVVGITNAINLLDGLDGLAGGASFIAAISLFSIFFLQQNIGFAIICLIFAGSILGFLKYNFHPASIFLGDSGAYYLGFMLSVLSIVGGHRGPTTIAILVPILALGLPIFDTLLSMTRRLLRSLHIMEVDEESNKIKLFFIDGWSMFKADRDHIHHRLLGIGFTHQKAVLFIYAICLIFGAIAFSAVYFKDINLGLFLSVIAIGTYLGVRKLGYSEVQILNQGVLLPLYDIPVINLKLLLVFVDIAFVIMAYYFSFLLRFEGIMLSEGLKNYFISTLPVVLTIKIVVFYLCGLYKGVWRFTNIGDLIKIAKTTFIASITSALALYFLRGFGIKSWSALIIEYYLLLSFIVGIRTSYRFLEYLHRSKQNIGRKTLIYGAGRRGAYALRELIHNSALGITPIGFIDDDPMKKGRSINGYSILTDLNHIEEILERNSISGIVISSEISKEKLNFLENICNSRKITLHRFEVSLEDITTSTPASNGG
jgi:UDP-GlcNAc:undecaprenyl-phosphate GlcNAc-1-phosphate transferase